MQHRSSWLVNKNVLLLVLPDQDECGGLHVFVRRPAAPGGWALATTYVPPDAIHLDEHGHRVDHTGENSTFLL